MSNRKKDVPGRMGVSLGLGLRKRQVAGEPPPAGGGALIDWDAEANQAVPVGWTFTRGSEAWYRNDVGVWQQVLSGTPRTQHNHFPGGGSRGYWPEQGSSKQSVHIRDLSDAVWIKTNMSVVRDAVGIDGNANSASTLTATAANATIFQPVTLSSSAHTHQAFVARKTGTGAVEMTIDGGSTWVDITSSLTAAIDNPFTVTQTLQDPSIGFRMVTSGDEIIVDCSELERLAFATSPVIQDSASTTTRDPDVMKTGITPAGPFSVMIDCTWPLPVDSSAARICMMSLTPQEIFFSNNNSQIRIAFAGGISAIAAAASSYEDERHKFAFSTETDNHIIVDDEDNSGTDLTGTFVTGEIYVGLNANLSQYFRGTIQSLIVEDGSKTLQELKDWVAVTAFVLGYSDFALGYGNFALGYGA